ncbi:unnamed protein product [Urochloa humidicola]
MAGAASNFPIITGRDNLAHLVAPVDEMWVSTRIVKQLGITHGDQTEVLIAFVKKVRHNPFVSVSVCLAKELGYHYFKIIKDYDPKQSGPDCSLFFVKVDSSDDVDKLNGHTMRFRAESVDFHQVQKFSPAIWVDAND